MLPILIKTVLAALWFYLTFSFFNQALAATNGSKCQNQNVVKPVNIMFFRPDGTTTSFWRASGKFAEAVATDLNVNLQTIIIPNQLHNRVSFKELVHETLSNHAPPDFVISLIYGGSEYVHIKQFNDFAIPFITINTSLDDKVIELTGKPREKFQHWKGHMSPNEILAGQRITADLASLSDGQTLAILAGSTRSVVSKHRVEGALTQAKKEQIHVIPPIHTTWTRESGKQAAKVLLQRVPDFDFLLTIGPGIADGAIELLSSANKKVVTGSFDWSQRNLELISQGRLDLTYGGHFMESGWSIILSYDYLHGIDFEQDPGTFLYSKLSKIDKSNLTEFEPIILEEQWNIVDFTQYSKCFTGTKKQYDFRLPGQAGEAD